MTPAEALPNGLPGGLAGGLAGGGMQLDFSHGLRVGDLSSLAYGFMLMLARIGTAMMVLPGIGETEIPTTIRAGLAVAITAALLPAVLPLMPAPPPDVAHLLAQLLAEIVTGLWMGWVARLVTLALPIAAQMIALLTGLSSIIQPDPSLGPQTSALSRIYSLAAPVLVLSSGLYALPLSALARSYRVIAPGTLLPAGDVTAAVSTATEAAFTLGLRLAAPFVLASVAWQVGMGMIGKLVPRLQIHFAAMPGQVLGGLVLLALLSTGLLTAWGDALQTAWAALPGAD